MLHLHQCVDSFSLEILLKHDYEEEERTVQKNKIQTEKIIQKMCRTFGNLAATISAGSFPRILHTEHFPPNCPNICVLPSASWI